MTILVPRLARDAAQELLRRHLSNDLAAITALMPDLQVATSFSPVGGTRVGRGELDAVRNDVVRLAREHGMPGDPAGLSAFEGKCARVLHLGLPMTPHEASHEEVWSYLTCCWLLDVAVWRFGRDADERRFIGNVNRNTFRRLWWRAEILGTEIDLGRLGEDELVNIMERPTIASDRRLARAIAEAFLLRVDRGEAPERMQVMREAMKRLLRLTPLVAFPSLDDAELGHVVGEAFDAALAGQRGDAPTRRAHSMRPPPQPSTDIVHEEITSVSVTDNGDRSDLVTRTSDFETVAQAAVDIASRVGRVTNLSLREVASISADEAREVFAELMMRGILVRRGVKRGTHYVLAGDSGENEATRERDLVHEVHHSFATADTEPSRDSALRRLLRRRST